jgi:hypothetical protein
MTVGGIGEQIVAESHAYVKITKEDPNTKQRVEEITERASMDETRQIFFNVCTSMLYRNCDPRENNCNGCEGYEKFCVNDFHCFRENFSALLTQTKIFIQEAEKYQWIRSGEEIIQGGSTEEKKDRLDMSEIEAFEEESDALFKQIHGDGDEKGFFVAAYETVDALREIARKAYCKILYKYYSTVMEIFNKATEKAKASFEIINGGLVVATGKEA